MNAIKKENVVLEQEIVREKALLRESEEPHQKLWQEKIAVESEITQELLKKVYTYFEKKSTEPVVYIFEALIGLMRKAPRADHKSVEIYLKKYEGFVMAVDRANVKQFNYTYCQQHLAELKNKYNAIIDQPDFKIFQPFRDLLRVFCDLGILAKEEVLHEEAIKTKEEKIQENLRTAETLNVLLNHVDV